MAFTMVARNSARRTILDHPAVPVTDTNVIETASACFEAAANGIPTHIRASGQLYFLDVEKRCEGVIKQLHTSSLNFRFK